MQQLLATGFLVLAAAAMVSAGDHQRATFDNYRVHSVDVDDSQQLLKLHQLEEAGLDGIEFWKSASEVGRRADIMVAPHQAAAFAELMDKMEVKHRVMVDNVQR